MSTVVVTKCDRCGKSIDKGGLRIDVSDNSSYTRYDMCAACAKDCGPLLGMVLTGMRRTCPYCDPGRQGRVRPLRDDEFDYAEVNVDGRQISLTHFFGECGDPMSFDTFIDIERCPMCGRRLA